jgi:hypothetical protein
MAGRAICVSVMLVTTLGCMGRSFSRRGEQGSLTGGSSGWIDVGGDSGGARTSSGGSGGAAGSLSGAAGTGRDSGIAPPACVVKSDPGVPGDPIGIEADWCNRQHTCAYCAWTISGVGIPNGAIPPSLCVLGDYPCSSPDGGAPDASLPICMPSADAGGLEIDLQSSNSNCTGITGSPCSLGGVMCAPSCAACPGTASRPSPRDGGTVDAGTLAACVAPFYPGGYVQTTFCNEEHSCAACEWVDATGINTSVPGALCTFAGVSCPDSSGKVSGDAGALSKCAVPAGSVFDEVEVVFDASGSASTCYGGNYRQIPPPSPDFALTPCQFGGFTCAPSCAACP